MAGSVVERQLRAALIASAGGYLRNPVWRSQVTCRICATPVDGYPCCYECNQHRVHRGLADAVAPVTYAVRGSQSGYIMRGYKAPRRLEAHYSVVATLMIFALLKHARCSEAVANAEVTHWTSVPSLPAKPGEHPFHHIVKDHAPGVEAPLRAADRATDKRAVNADHFVMEKALPSGSHVLLLDDTWAKGGHAQSAALALRRAGAQKVSVLVAARWINPGYKDNGAFIKTLPDYEPDICPWTGSDCP
ncbi:hypothetical protein [Actinomadura hibisca]|uniref:hypothetical protein n=1 Tax=Actinomadura hibisca TaxID=68565 RepID=UPI000832820E|nr:hypothetical protein [Actinomadura hibisca]